MPRENDQPAPNTLALRQRNQVSRPTPPREAVPFVEQAGAGLYMHSILGARARAVQLDQAGPDDPDFDPFMDSRVQDDPSVWSLARDARSKEQLDVMLAQRERAADAEEALSAPGGTAAALVASLANPSTLTPLSLAKGKTLLDAAHKGVKAGIVFALPEEAYMTANMQERTATDALTNVALMAGLNGLLNTAATAPALAAQRRADSLNIPVPPRGTTVTESATGRNADSGVSSESTTGGAFWGPHADTAEPELRSVGAAASRTTVRSVAEALQREGIVPSGTGTEKLPWNPITRMTKSDFAATRKGVEELVSMGGIQKRKNTASGGFEATARSAEVEIAQEYNFPMVQALRFVDEQFLAYRGRAAKEGDFNRTFEIGKVQLSDAGRRLRGQRPEKLSAAEFREEVAKAMRRNDEHEIAEVAAAARENRKLFKRLEDEAVEEDLFARPMEKEIATLKKQLRSMEARRQTADSPTQADDIAAAQRELEGRIGALNDRLDSVRKHGPTVNTAQSYVPRIWRIDRIEAERDRLERILFDHFRADKEFRAMETNELRAYVNETIDYGLLKHKPYAEIREGTDDIVADAAPLRERTLDIPDELVEDFLENDIEAITRHHVRQLGTDITLSRRFGDISARSLVEQITEEGEAAIAKATGGAEKARLRKQLEADLRDVRALRDRLRGTYGLPSDPYKPLSRAARIAKIWNVLTMGGGFQQSAIPDLARTVMTEGLVETFGTAGKLYFSKAGKAIRAMNRRELQQAGTALDMVLGTRAMQFADVGDMFGRRYPFERALFRGQGAFFIVNGLHAWNTAMKEMAGAVIGVRILEVTGQVARNVATDADLTKLARSGIDPAMARRIAAQGEKYGETIDGVRMPNTDDWDDIEAMRVYRTALQQDADRTIVTPGAGDRALWTSTEFGSVIAQFSSFGQASLQRVLISGMQEKDAAFFTGLALLVGLGYLTNEIKRALYGDTRERTFMADMVDAVDRSGALGAYADINNRLERILDYKVGLRPMLGLTKPYEASVGAKMGSVLGPTGSQLANLSDWTADVLSGDTSRYTWDKVERSIPLNNHPAVDLLQRLGE